MGGMNRSRKLWTFAGRISRRELAVRVCLGVAGTVVAGRHGVAQGNERSELALARNQDRRTALKGAFALLGKMDFGGKDLYLKGNYGSADPYPATTHQETLDVVVALLRESNCGEITLVERSAMGLTRDIWDNLGVTAQAKRLGVRLVALEELAADQWRKADLPGSNWKAGIEVPAFLDQDTYLIQVCNLKTHRFGGIFSASLKNSVGLVAKEGKLNAGYNYMRELHASAQQGAMIAEINLTYRPKLVIMDAMQAFVTGGPDTGEIANPDVVLASSDRLAIDAAGVALLRLQRDLPGEPINLRPIYDQDQLKRAIELNLGARNATEIRFLTADTRSALLATQLESNLQEVPKPKK